MSALVQKNHRGGQHLRVKEERLKRVGVEPAPEDWCLKQRLRPFSDRVTMTPATRQPQLISYTCPRSRSRNIITQYTCLARGHVRKPVCKRERRMKQRNDVSRRRVGDGLLQPLPAQAFAARIEYAKSHRGEIYKVSAHQHVAPRQSRYYVRKHCVELGTRVS